MRLNITFYNYQSQPLKVIISGVISKIMYLISIQHFLFPFTFSFSFYFFIYILLWFWSVAFKKKVWSTTSSSIMPCLTALSTVIKKPKKNLEISLPKNNTFLLKFFLFQYYPSIFLLFFFWYCTRPSFVKYYPGFFFFWHEISTL